jgi:hypothetical protein
MKVLIAVAGIPQNFTSIPQAFSKSWGTYLMSLFASTQSLVEPNFDSSSLTASAAAQSPQMTSAA